MVGGDFLQWGGFCPTKPRPQVMVVFPFRRELPPVHADKALALLPLHNLLHPNTKAKPITVHSFIQNTAVSMLIF